MRNALLTIAALVLCTVAQAQSDPATTDCQPAVYEPIPVVSQVLQFATKHLNLRYRSGGTSRNGFDCSGFTRYCYQQFGVRLPHSSAAQGTVGVSVDRRDVQPGDLVFFNGHRAGGSRIGHVGMVVGVSGQQVKFIHSAWNGGVRYDYLHADYYARRFRSVRRVVNLLAQN
jgi:murein DD-endopeptidase / murein LD-carboxypeptidase